MNNEKNVPASPATGTKSTLRVPALRLILAWMFICFVYWLIAGHLPSLVLDHTGVKNTLPSVLKQINPATLHMCFVAVEILFSASLLVCILAPGSVKLVGVHIFASILLALCLYSVTAGTLIPFTGYIVIYFSFLFNDEAKFARTFDFLQTIVVCVMVYYAANWYLKWYQYIQAPSLKTMINANANELNLSARDTVTKNIMPWYYAIYLIFVVRIFTTRWNRILFGLACVVIFLEYFLNLFFDPTLLFMLIPFINPEILRRQSKKKNAA